MIIAVVVLQDHERPFHGPIEQEGNATIPGRPRLHCQFGRQPLGFANAKTRDMARGLRERERGRSHSNGKWIAGGGSRPPAAYSSVHCPQSDVPGGPTGCYLVPPGIHKIKHVIVILQENRSFDSYFGTYPGADGIPMKNGQPTVCVPDR